MPRQQTTRTREEPEYRLLITPRIAERTQRSMTLVVLETTKAFATFRYELSVKAEQTASSLRFTVLGFRTPQLSLPASGPARFEQEFEHLDGTFEVSVKGIDGRTTSFSLRITPEQVKVLKAPRKSFVQIATTLTQWNSQVT
jgi:hypothetical protein